MRAIGTEAPIEQYSQKLVTDKPLKSINTIQNQTGFEITPHMKIYFFYRKLRILHIQFIQEEIRFHSAIFDRDWSIKKLVSKLKEMYVQEQKEHKPNSKVLNKKRFIPLYCTTVAYNASKRTG